MKWKEKMASRLYRSFCSSMHSLPALSSEIAHTELFSLFNFNHGWVLLVSFEWVTPRWVWRCIACVIRNLYRYVSIGVYIEHVQMRSFFRSWFCCSVWFIVFFFIWICIFKQFSIFSSISLTNDAKWPGTLLPLTITK